MPVTLDATASIVPDGRYPAPTEVVPGQKLRTPAGTANIELPAYLAPFGYAVGLLQPGLNELPVKVWIAISATNTKERVQVVGPFDVTATDDDHGRSRPTTTASVSATPWQYTTPAIAGAGPGPRSAATSSSRRTRAATCRSCRSATAAPTAR